MRSTALVVVPALLTAVSAVPQPARGWRKWQGCQGQECAAFCDQPWLTSSWASMFSDQISKFCGKSSSALASATVSSAVFEPTFSSSFQEPEPTLSSFSLESSSPAFSETPASSAFSTATTEVSTSEVLASTSASLSESSPSSSSSVTESHSSAVTSTPSSSTLSTTHAPSTMPASSSAALATSSDVAAYLSAHNDFRAQHGADALTWNDTLATAAQNLANTCVFQHSGGPYGENLSAGTGSYSIAAAVKVWTDESSKYSVSDPSSALHFTQVVWKSTKQLGCAVQSCDGIFDASYGKAQYYVCEYYPPGNVAGQFADNVQA